MNYTEQPILFPCEDETLLGILAQPETPAQTGVVIVVGGPQYRAGSHRQFVLLARKLAATGYPVLRFDYRGMGDSTGDFRTFENVNADVNSAINALQSAVPDVRKVVLWGLCDGASAALLYCHASQDARVGGLCLLNPWVRSAASLAKTHVKHYYTQRLRQKEFWIKLLSGRVASSAFDGLARNIKTALFAKAPLAAAAQLPFQDRMAMAWNAFDGPILLLLSGDDYTAKEFVDHAKIDPAWSGTFLHARLVRHDLPEAGHTFSDAASRAQTEDMTLAWLDEQAVPRKPSSDEISAF